jgi:hypothetical protein
MPDVTDQCIDRVLPALSCLQEVDISGCSLVTDSSLQRLTWHMTLDTTSTHTWKLRELNLSGLSKLTGQSLSWLTHVVGSELISLDVAGFHRLDDDVFNAIALHCPNLERLNMAGCFLAADRSVNALSSCATLKSLDLSFCFSIATLRSLAQCRLLQDVTLRKARDVVFLIPSIDIQYLYYHCPDLHDVLIL